MNTQKLEQLAFKGINVPRKLYWKIFQPKTYGVMALVLHPQEEAFLGIQQSYGDKNHIKLPGGGYNPRKENSITAAKREVHEELKLSLTSFSQPLITNHLTQFEGKRDHLSIIALRAADTIILPNREVSEYYWINFDLIGIPANYTHSRFIDMAIKEFQK